MTSPTSTSSQSLQARMRALQDAAHAPATRSGYASDVRHYRLHGGPLPATPHQLARYLTRFAGQLAVSTLQRRLAALQHWHRLHGPRGHPNPVHSPLVQQTLAGVRRLYGQPPRQVKALVKADLLKLVRTARAQGGLRACRDSALLLLGFAAALRRSELVALQVSDLAFHARGLDVTVRRSKTDRSGQGATLFVPWGPKGLCAAKAVRQWLEAAGLKAAGSVGLDSGQVFRALDRYGQVRGAGLSGQSVALIIKRLATQVWGVDAAAGYAGHSLRAGFCTQAALLNWPGHWIAQQSRHKSEAMVQRYIRPAGPPALKAVL